MARRGLTLKFMQMRRRVLFLVLFLVASCQPGRFATGVQQDLIDAARDGDAAAIRAAIAKGADPNAIDQGENGWTPLMHAIHKGQAASVAALLDAGADPNRRGRGGDTPLMMAAGYGYAPIVQQLLACGADRNLTNRKGETALDFALAGVTDIDRFTYFECQDKTATLLAGAPARAASIRWAQVKGCGSSKSAARSSRSARSSS